MSHIEAQGSGTLAERIRGNVIGELKDGPVSQDFARGYNRGLSDAAQIAELEAARQPQATGPLAESLSSRKWPVISRGVNCGEIQLADDAVREICRIAEAEGQRERERLEQNTRPLTFSDRGSDALALAVFDWIERGVIPTRSRVSDALESWAACRFDCLDGTEIDKLRAFAQAAKPRSDSNREWGRNAEVVVKPEPAMSEITRYDLSMAIRYDGFSGDRGGRHFVLYSDVQQFQATLTAAEAERTRLRRVIDECQCGCHETGETHSGMKRTINTLREKLTAAAATIAGLREELSEQRQEVDLSLVEPLIVALDLTGRYTDGYEQIVRAVAGLREEVEKAQRKAVEWHAAMVTAEELAAKVLRERDGLEFAVTGRLKRTEAQIALGKGEWPNKNYVKDETWMSWRHEVLTLKSILFAAAHYNPEAEAALAAASGQGDSTAAPATT